MIDSQDPSEEKILPQTGIWSMSVYPKQSTSKNTLENKSKRETINNLILDRVNFIDTDNRKNKTACELGVTGHS